MQYFESIFFCFLFLLNEMNYQHWKNHFEKAEVSTENLNQKKKRRKKRSVFWLFQISA